MKDRNRAYLLTFMVILFWSTVPSAFKITLRYLSVPELLLFSTLVSTSVLFIILLFQKKINLLRTLKKNDYLHSALLGFLNPFFYYLVVFKAYSLLPAQQAQPLNLSWGVVLVLISIPILKQNIQWVNIAAILISFSGVVVISTEGDFANFQVKNPEGVALAVGSSIIFASYWILNVKDKKDPVLRLFLNFVFALVFMLLGSLLIFSIKAPPVKGILGACYVGMFEMGFTYVLWIKALKLSEKTVNVTILIYLIPFISFIFIHIFVGETIMVSSVLGAVLIVLGIILNKYRELKKRR